MFNLNFIIARESNSCFFVPQPPILIITWIFFFKNNNFWIGMLLYLIFFFPRIRIWFTVTNLKPNLTKSQTKTMNGGTPITINKWPHWPANEVMKYKIRVRKEKKGHLKRNFPPQELQTSKLWGLGVTGEYQDLIPCRLFQIQEVCFFLNPLFWWLCEKNLHH